MTPKAIVSSLVLGGALFIAVFSCKKTNEVPQARRTKLQLSEEPENYFENDRQRNLKAQLGKVLFYDNILSTNNGVSCGSCHKQANAFADTERFSKGFDGRVGSRNTPTIQNLAMQGQSLFWDGREDDLKTMVLKPVFNHIEMGIISEKGMLENITTRYYYPDLFAKVYNSSVIDKDRVADALSHFVAAMKSTQSRFESARSNDGQLTQDEQKGQELFFGKYNCGSCHNLFDQKGYSDGLIINSDSPIDDLRRFTGRSIVNIGLDAQYADKGKAGVSNNPADNGKFKIPNLRNVELTVPYMHDGRFNTLEEVIDHYANGVKNHPNLDDRLKNPDGSPKTFTISKEDKRLLIAFLKTLTDKSFTTDPKFSDPFISL